MKKISVIVFGLLLAATSQAQLKAKVDCGVFDVDVLDGKVNGLKANTIPGQIKRTWTCFTKVDSASAKCGDFSETSRDYPITLQSESARKRSVYIGV